MAKAKNPSKKAASANGDARTSDAAAPKKLKTTSALQTSSAADNKTANGNASHPSPATETSVYPSVSEETIRQRAYELYTQRGGQHGGHRDDWFRAETELRGRK